LQRVSTHALRSGMKVGRSVYTNEGVILIKAGMHITEKNINRLKILDIPSIYIEDGFVDDIEIKEVISQQTRADAIKRVRDLFNKTEVHSKAGKITVILNEDKLTHIVETLLSEVLNSKDIMISLTDIRAFDDYTFAHSVNVCVLALITGKTLGLSKKSLTQLGIGAVLHDLGKVFIPKEILNKPDTLSVNEFEVVKKHPEDGFKLVKAKGMINDLSASVIFEHHERYNGSGYPRGLKKKQIHLYGRIVGVVDTYDALTADRVYRNAYLPYQAYEMLAGSGDNQFDYEVVKAFLSNIAIYPIGTFVELNTGQVGAVVDVIKGLTHRPKIRVFFEESARPVGHPYEVDLTSELSLMIDKVLKFEDLEKLSTTARRLQFS